MTNIIKTNAKIKSQEYIEEVIKTEILKEDYNFFYQSVTEEGMLRASFDTNLANKVVSDSMTKLRKISNDFNQNTSFDVSVPISYLFIPQAYFLPNIKLNVETSGLLYYDVALKTRVTEYGINSSLVNLSLIINITFQVVVPLMIEIVDNSIEVPIALEIINGKVPEVLFNY